MELRNLAVSSVGLEDDAEEDGTGLTFFSFAFSAVSSLAALRDCFCSCLVVNWIAAYARRGQGQREGRSDVGAVDSP